MNNTTTVNRDKKLSCNALVYRYFKEDELAELTDAEFAVLQNKLKPRIIRGTGSLYAFQEGMNAEGLHGDALALGIYRRSMAAHHFYFDCFQRYSRAFTICYRLGVRHFYDIGCGQQMQGFLTINVPETTYTGIDPEIFNDLMEEFSCEPDVVNTYFERFTGSDRIQFIKKTYPCDLTIKENNVAILFGVFMPEAEISSIASAMARDFERVMISIPTTGKFRLEGTPAKEIIEKDLDVWSRPFENRFEIWKNSMPDFEFYKLGSSMIFGTKCAEDKNILETKYLVLNDRVYTDAMDQPWYNMLMEERTEFIP